MKEQAASFAAAWERIHDLCSILRGKAGCPWDRAQTSRTLTPYLVEEIHEMIEANRGDSRERLIEEAGDVVYLMAFFLQLIEEERAAAIAEIVGGVEAKLIRRRPNVFGGTEADLLERLPASLPALARARRLQEKAAAFSFDWSEPEEVIAKIREELDELSAALAGPTDESAVAEELGDLLFAVVNLSRHLRQDSEAALASATEKFRDRFNRMAASVERSGLRMGEASLELLEEHWQQIKTQEKARTPPSDRK